MFRLLGLMLLLLLSFSCADLKLAKEYYARGDYEEAVDHLKPLAERGFPEANYLLGKIIAEGKLKGVPPEKAIPYLEKAYEKGIKKSLLLIAKIYLKEGKVDEAVKYLELAAKEGVPGAKELLVKTLLQHGKVNERVIKEALKLAKEDPFLYKLVAEYYLKRGEKEKAKELLLKAYGEGVKDAGLLLASILIREGKLDEAEELLKEIYRRYADREAALKLGKIYEIKAKKVRLKACPLEVAKTPKDYFRLKLELQSKRKELYLAATEWYKRALPLLEAQYRLQRLQWILEGNPCGDYRVIKEFAEKGLEVAISDLQRLYGSGRCPVPETFVQKGEVPTSLKEAYGRQVEATKENPGEILFRRAMELLNNNPKKALELLKEGCRYGNTKAEVELALLLVDQKPELAGAVLYYYAKEKRMPRAMVALAKLYKKYGYEDRFLYWIKRAAELRYTPAMRILALYLLKHDRVEEAMELLKKWEDENYCFASILLGAIYEGDYGYLPIDFKKAEYHYRLAARRGCVEAHFRLARLYLFLGQPEKALRYAEKYHRLMPREIKGFVMLARVYIALKEPQKAAEFMKKAVEMGYLPGYGEISKLLGYLPVDLLLSGELKYRTYTLIAQTLGTDDYPLSFCLAYEAGLHRAPRAAMVLFNVATLAETREQGLLVIRAAKDPSVCRRIIERKRRKIERFLSRKLPNP